MLKLWGLSLLILSAQSMASIGEVFGPCPESQAIAGIASFDSACSNYQAGSTLAFAEASSFSLGLSRLSFNFKGINNVLVSSPVNSNPDDPEKFGDASVDYEDQEILSLHAVFPFLNFNKSKLGLSVFLPMNKILEAGTGDPYRPEYSLYRNRFLRTIFHVNYIQPIGETWGLSLGAMSGIRSKGETYVVANDSGSDYPSSGKLGFDASPTFSFQFSLTKNWNKGSKSFFAFQDESKSKLENKVSGVTPLGSSSLAYNLAASSMLYYDPRVYRLSHREDISSLSLFASLEYQDWSGYESPQLKLENEGGILVSSGDATNFSLRNVWVPRIGLEKRFESFSLQTGLAYRPSPLKLHDERPGNQIDTDAVLASLGAMVPFDFKGEKFELQLAAQYQQLLEKTVNKTGPRENGEDGDKIGSPSYKIGGNVTSISFGLSWGL